MDVGLVLAAEDRYRAMKVRSCYYSVTDREPQAERCPDMAAIRTTLGPMARSIEALELGCRAIISAAQSLKVHETQASMLPVPWRSVELEKKLKFGYFIEGELSHKLSYAIDACSFAIAMQMALSARPLHALGQ